MSIKSSTPTEVAFSFDELMEGLGDALAHAEGKLTLRTSILPSPAPTMKPKEIRALREELNLSQALFGRLLNVPPVTILKWEHGERKPSGAALRLLEIAKRAPDVLMGIRTEGIASSVGDAVKATEWTAKRLSSSTTSGV